MSIIKNILSTVDRIKPLSPSANGILSMLTNDNYSLKEIESIVKQDPALTANLLRIVNSASFGLKNEIFTVSRAVFFLGIKVVAALAIGSSASQVYDTALEGYQAERGALWFHCLKTAIAAREFAMFTKSDLNPELAYTGGILHDIGKVIISDYLSHANVQKIVDSEDKVDFLSVESRETGYNHMEVGVALAEHWNLPLPLVEVIGNHHEPQNAPDDLKPLVFTVHMADLLAMSIGTGTGLDAMAYKLDDEYKEFFTMKIADLETIFVAVESEFAKISEEVFGKDQE